MKGNSNIDRSGQTGIVNGAGTLDLANKQASIEWTRPFDVSSDKTLTLEANKTTRIWLTWGNFLADIDNNALTLSKKNQQNEFLNLTIQKPPAILYSATKAIYI